LRQRIRTIKPEFFKHYDLYRAEKESRLPLRLAFASLFTVADREGRFKWRPEELKAYCLPYDRIDFSRVLDALSTRGFIEQYECAGELYGWIPTFLKHQAINNRENKSELPDPLDADTSTRGARVGHAWSDFANLDKAERERERERKGTEGKTTFARSDSVPESSTPESGDVFTDLPCTGKTQSWPVTKSYIAEMAPLYPGIDIEAEILRAKGWLLNNPQKRKTDRGMTSFLGRWFAREQDRVRSPVVRPTPHPDLRVGESESGISESDVAAIREALAEIERKPRDKWTDTEATVHEVYSNKIKGMEVA